MPKTPHRGSGPPLVLLVDKPQRIQVRITNRGGDTWRAAGEDRTEFQLSWLRADGSEAPGCDAPARLTADIGPGESQQLSLTATPPATGPANLRLRGAGASGLSAQSILDCAVVVVTARDYARGALTIAQPLPPLPAGADVSIPVLLHNRSKFDWQVKPPALFNLRGRLGTVQFTMRLAENVAAGQSLLIKLPVRMPAEPGRHKLRLALTRPGAVNFNDFVTFEAPTVDLQVVDAQSTELDTGFQREAPRILLYPPAIRPVGVVGEPLRLNISLLNERKSAVQLAYLESSWLVDSGTNPASRLKLDGALLPGVRRRVDLSMTPPSPGILTARIRLSIRLGDREEQPVDIGRLEAEIIEQNSVIRLEAVCLSAPPILLCEEEQTLALQMTNSSAQPVLSLSQQDLILVQRWSPIDAKRAPQLRGGRHLRVPARSGDCEVLLLPLSPPPEAGRYLVEFHVHRLNAPLADQAIEFGAPPIECEVVRRGALSFAAEKLLRKDLAFATDAAERLAYAQWASREDTFAGGDRDRLGAYVAGWPRLPLVSVLVPLTARTLPLAAVTVSSVLDQIYQNWQLCIGFDPKLSASDVRETLGGMSDDPRILIRRAPGGADVAALWRTAAALAEGDFCQLAFPGDVLAAHSLVFFCGELVRDERVAVLYSDRDQLDAGGARHSPAQLPGLDPDLMLGRNYIGRGLGVKAADFRAALPQRGLSDAAWYHELTVRLADAHAGERFRHIPNILYHCGSGIDHGSNEWAAGERALNEYLSSNGRTERVSCLHEMRNYRLRVELPNPAPRVSIIIPTRDGLSLLAPCIASIIDRTNYPDYEIIIIDNGSERADMLDYLGWLSASGRARVIRDDGDFNWSRLNNRGAAEATGEIFCLLNDDTEVLNDSWLRELVSHAVRPDVGVVGAALWFPNGTLQHGGIAFDFGLAMPFATLRLADREMVRQLIPVVQSTGAITGACLVTRRDVFEAAGRMDEVRFPVGYNDIDYGLRVREYLGLRCVWTPFAELIHKESISRGTPRTEDDRDNAQREASTFAGRWRDTALRDPHFQPVFDLQRGVKPRPRAGAVASAIRYQLPRRRPIAFVHIPRTAGLSVRDLLQRAAPGLTMSDLSARMLLGCYQGDEAVVTQLHRWLGDVDVLVSRASFGFGGLVGWDCAYATVLRDPVERALSQHQHLLRAPSSPIWETALRDAPLDLLLRKGVLRGNLQLHKILGSPPERARWSDVDGIGSEFAGFDLPVDVWRRRFDSILDGPDIAPEEDMALVDQAIAIIKRHFAFVGRREGLESHMAEFMRVLGIDGQIRPAPVNVPPDAGDAPSSGDIALLEEFNCLDRALYNAIVAMPLGMLTNAAVLGKHPV